MRTFEELVEEFAKIDMDPGCHMDSASDYDSVLDFYLSMVSRDDYVSHYLEDSLSEEELEAYDKSEIQEAVIRFIEEKVDKLDEVITSQEAADILEITDRAVRLNCENGRYVARKTGRNWLILKDSLFR